MKKLPSLNLEVIRFTTEDVIVTSGTGTTVGATYSPLTEGVTYFAFGSEINDYTGKKERRKNYFSTFCFDPSTGSFTILNMDVCKETEVGSKRTFNYPYAWYNDNDIAWVTENKTKEYYLENGWTH